MVESFQDYSWIQDFEAECSNRKNIIASLIYFQFWPVKLDIFTVLKANCKFLGFLNFNAFIYDL